MADVAVNIVADSKSVTTEINKTIREVRLMGQAIDTSNDIAVRTWKKAADAAQEYLNKVSATKEQHLRLQVATRSTEDRIESMGERYARAGERGERALSNLMRTGELTGKSVNNLMNAAGDLGFAFSPQGALASGILMMGVAIAQHLEKAEEKMQEVADKFSHHMNEMLADSSAVDAAKAAARAYVTELESIAKLKQDSTTLGSYSLRSVLGNQDLAPAIRALMRRGGREDAVQEAGSQRVAGDLAAMALANIEVHDKELEDLAKRRKEANADIVQAQSKLDGLERKGHEAEYAAAERALGRARRELADAEQRTRALEADRAGRVREEQALASGDPARVAALGIAGDRHTNADFGQEHADRTHEANRAVAGSDERRGRAADQAAERKKRDNEERAKEERRAGYELTKIQDEATQDAVKAIGLKDVAEAMAINSAHDRRLREIEDMKVSEQMKADFRRAADDLQLAQLADLNRRVGEENDRAAAKQKQQDDEATKKRVQATTTRVRLIEQVEHGAIDAIVSGHKDMGRKVLKALLEPEVKHLEALSAKHLAMAAADFATGNFVGGAKQAAAGVLYAAGATAVASFGDGGGGGGGGKGGGGGGGGSSSGLGASLATSRGGGDQTLKIEIVNVTKDQTGREVARTRQVIQRLEDQNQPIRVTL